MMLHAIAHEHRRATVVHVDRAGHRNRALGQQQPVALVDGDLEMVGDDVELGSRHVEHRPGEKLHDGPP